MGKRIFIAIVLVLASALAFQAEGRNLRILYWNIQNGMWSDQGNNYDNFVEFVKGEDPDICVWCEAESRYFTDSVKRIENCEDAYLPWNWDLLARRYGHKYVLVSGKRDTFPQVITSKYPIKIVKRVNGDGKDVIVVHGAGVAQIEVGGKTLNIVTIHSWPYKYAYGTNDKKASSARKEGAAFRATEMEYICKETIGSVPDAASQYWMMLGDFNARSRVDNYFYKMAEDDKDFLVHDYIRNNTPYIDIIEKLYPGDFQATTYSGKRIDLIYMTEPLFKRVRSAEIIRTGFAKSELKPEVIKFCRPSDHYPIRVDLKF